MLSARIRAQITGFMNSLVPLLGFRVACLACGSAGIELFLQETVRLQLIVIEIWKMLFAVQCTLQKTRGGI
jgi:hypothetical protein